MKPIKKYLIISILPIFNVNAAITETYHKPQSDIIDYKANFVQMINIDNKASIKPVVIIKPKKESAPIIFTNQKTKIVKHDLEQPTPDLLDVIKRLWNKAKDKVNSYVD